MQPPDILRSLSVVVLGAALAEVKVIVARMGGESALHFDRTDRAPIGSASLLGNEKRMCSSSMEDKGAVTIGINAPPSLDLDPGYLLDSGPL